MKRLTYCEKRKRKFCGANFVSLSNVLYDALANRSTDELDHLKSEIDGLIKEIEKTNSCEGCIHYHGGEYDATCEECHRAYEDDYYETEEAEVKEAHWITKGHEMGFCHCSECLTVSDWQHNYCPNCGAKMDGDVK